MLRLVMPGELVGHIDTTMGSALGWWWGGECGQCLGKKGALYFLFEQEVQRLSHHGAQLSDGDGWAMMLQRFLQDRFKVCQLFVWYLDEYVNRRCQRSHDFL